MDKIITPLKSLGSKSTNKTLKKYLLLFVLILGMNSAWAQSPYTSVTSGNWNSDATWSGTGVPGVGDVVNIANGHTVTVTATAAASSITFTGAAATLSVDSGITATISGAIVLNSSTTSNTAATISGLGTVTAASITSGTNVAPTGTTYTNNITSTISNLTISGNLTILTSRNGSGANARYNNSSFLLDSGNLTVSGIVTTLNSSGNGSAATAAFILGDNAPYLKLTGATPFSLTTSNLTNTITLDGTNATVEYSLGGSQSIYATTYNNLTLSGTGTKTFTATTTIGNNLDIKTSTIAALGTSLNHPAKVLLFNGVQQIAGTWGYTGSGATNINTTFFSNTTGRVNVSGRFYSNGGAPNVLASWTANRNNTGATPANFSTTGQEFYVQNGHSITTSAAWTVTGTNNIVRIENGGTLTSSFAITLPVSAIFQIDNGGTYIHNNTGTASSTIFGGTEVFGASSNVRIDNWTSAATVLTTGVLLPFGNLELNWNPGGTWSQTLTGSVNLTAGNFTISTFGSNELRLTPATTGTALTLTIGGNFSASTGIIVLVGGGSAQTKACTLNVGGNVSLTGTGILDMNLNQATSGAVAVNIGGDFLISGTAVLRNSLGSGTRTVTFNNASSNQTFTSTAGGINTNPIAFVVGTGTSTNTLQLLSNFVMNNTGSLTVANNASLNTGTNIVQATTANTQGNFTLSNGGTLLIGSTAGITSSGTASGNIQTSTTRSFSSTANYTYNGSGAQVVGTGLPATVNNLAITNTSGVTLSTAKVITGNLSIGTGASLDLGSLLTHTSGSLTLAGSAQSTGTSYGGTGSPAANISSSFAANTGVLNVGSCGSYSLTSTAATAVCIGGSSTVTLTNTTPANLPVGTYTVFYTLTGTNTGSTSTSMTVTTAGTGSFTTSSLTNGGGPTTITIDYIRNGCVSRTVSGNSASISINAVPVGPVIAKNPNADVCAGATLTISVTTAGTGGAISSQDEYRYDNGSGFSSWSASLPSFAAVTGTNTIESRRTSTGSGCTTASGNTVSWTVNAVPVGPVIAKSPNVAAVCAGATLTISITTAGTGGAVSSQDEYRYNDGSGFSSWSTSIPSFAAVVGTNTVESRRTSTGSGCTTASGNTVSWTVNAVPVGPVIAKSPNAAAVCAGANLTISITTAGTGGAISSQDEYRYDDGSGFTAWSTSLPIFTAVLGTNTVESRRTSTGSGCTTAAGNTVSWTVNAVPVGPVIAKSPNVATVCAGATLTLSVTTAGTGGAISSQDEYRYDTGSGFASWSTSLPSFAAVSGTNTIESRRISTGSGCTTAAGNTVSWTVNAIFTSGAIATTGETICYGGTPLTAIGNLTPAGGGDGSITYSWRSSADGYTADIGGATSPTYTPPSGLTITTSYRRYANDGTCNVTPTLSSGTWTITVRPDFTPGEINTTGETICYGGSPTLGINSITDASGGDGSITYVWQANGVDIPSSNSETFDPPPGLTVTTTYTRFAKDNTCNPTFTISTGSWVVTVSTENTWTGSVSTAWSTAGNWSCGSVPVSATDVIISTAGLYPVIASDVSINSLTLDSGTTLSVNGSIDLTVTDAITNNGGTFTLSNNANLMQDGTTNTNTGNITVNRDSSALKRLDYTLWSSPVTGQGLYAFSRFTLPNRFYVYDTDNNAYSNAVGFSLTGLQYPSPLVSPNGVDGTDSANVQFTTGQGYLIRVPYDHPTTPTVYHGSFTGVPNSGDITVPVSLDGTPAIGDGFNAVGNPYPSRISVQDFIGHNTNTTGTLYFWRKTNNASADSYASLTSIAYTANPYPGGDTGAGYFDSGEEDDWVLNIGQGFFVQATSGSTIEFLNTMRRSSNENQFFKAPPTTTNSVNGLYWLNLNSAAGSYSQMAVGYVPGGTLDFDRGIDGANINKEFYLTSLIGTGEYTIQGRPDFQSSDIVPLSYKATTAGTHTISIDHTSGLFNGGSQAIYLKDNLTNTEHNLQTGAYSFTSAVGTFNNRFEIHYESQLGIENPIFNENNVVVYSQNNAFVINSGNFTMASIKVFDIRGRLIEEKKDINANQTTIKGGLANGVLLVQVTSEDGATVTKRVIK